MRHFSLFDSHFIPSAVAASQTDTARVTAFAIDASETDQAFVLRADLPGFAKDDIAIEVVGKLVKISTSKTRTSEMKEGERLLRAERFSGEFSRQFKLTVDIDEQSVSATLADGVLELTLPKKARAGARKITIQ